MAEVEYSVITRLPVDAVWDFVKEMDNWAPFVQGYQTHTKHDETDSEWTLKGDVGVLARTVRFRVRVTEWQGPERVRFELEGLNEPMQGHGTFSLARVSDGASPPPAPARKGPFERFFAALARLLYRLVHGRVEREEPDATLAAGGARMTFVLRLDPGGPMAPMVNALMKPLLVPAAEDLANQIVATLERSRAPQSE